MHPRNIAQESPNKLAVVMGGSGETLTFGELEIQANKIAHFFREHGFEPQDRVAFLLENRLEIFPFVCAAQRSGMYFVPVSVQLKTKEIVHILADSEAKIIVSSDCMEEDILDALTENFPHIHRFTLGQSRKGWDNWGESIESFPAHPITDECRGTGMMYSSGTTGLPKGVMPQVPANDPIDTPHPFLQLIAPKIGVHAKSIYLCPAPLYHAGPLGWSISLQAMGCTVVVMEKFDPVQALRLIEDHKISVVQFVPTHFIRLLKLSDSVRKQFDTSSLESVVHASAPCPIPVKRQMIDWWGPIIYEFYAGSEGNGMTMIDSVSWLAHPGSVGKPEWGLVHICDENGEELPWGEEGTVYFEGGVPFSYHKDSEKTSEVHNASGWSTLGDVGRLDDQGYLYLTDRKSFMIISGGVNIYPQEIENHLIVHPKVADVAVIGAPDEEMGERVVAVVQPIEGVKSGTELAQELEQYCRESLSGVKIPRQIDFRDTLPRTDTGKLFKRLIRDEYWRDKIRC